MNLNSLIAESIYQQNVAWLRRIPKNILSELEKNVVDSVIKYYEQYKETPSFNWMTTNFPNWWLFTPPKSNDTLGSIFDIFVNRLTDEAVFNRSVILSTKYTHDGVLDDKIIEEMARLNKGKYGFLNTLLDINEFTIDEFENSQGIMFDVGPLDEISAGLQNGEFALIVGRPASLKTTFAIWLAYKQYLFNNKNVLIISKEMKYSDLFAKINAFIAGVNPLFYRQIAKMTLHEKWNSEKYIRLKTAEQILKYNTHGKILSPKRNIVSPLDVQDIINESEEKIDLVVIDGVYLMGKEKEQSYERVSEVSRGLKQITLDCDVPILGVTQANRSGKGKSVGLENISYADALGQDADLALVVVDEDEDDTPQDPFVKNKVLKVIKNRYGPSGLDFPFVMNFEKMELNFNG